MTCATTFCMMETNLLHLLQSLHIQPIESTSSNNKPVTVSEANEDQEDKANSDDDEDFEEDFSDSQPDQAKAHHQSPPSGSSTTKDIATDLSCNEQNDLPMCTSYPPPQRRERHRSGLTPRMAFKKAECKSVTLDTSTALTSLTTPCEATQQIPSHHDLDHCLSDTSIIARQLAEEMCSSTPKTYPPEVFDNFASVYVKALRDNNGKEDPSFIKLANDIDSIRSTLDLPAQPHIFKRDITGFSCDDLQCALFAAHDGSYPEYFAEATAC